MIIELPVFSRSISELVYDALFFAEDYSDDKHYADLFDYQSANMWPDGTDLKLLEDAVKSMPNLRAVYYTNWYILEDSVRPWYLEVVNVSNLLTPPSNKLSRLKRLLEKYLHERHALKHSAYRRIEKLTQVHVKGPMA